MPTVYDHLPLYLKKLIALAEEIAREQQEQRAGGERTKVTECSKWGGS
jgi:hypothetical protein